MGYTLDGPSYITWDDPFDTDREALEEVMEVIERDGIRSFLEGESEDMH